ncbi:MAG: ATP-binding cassette domain-containing protein, partial [Cyanobacteria bacterium Co-bin8]|nr:ATP-binding cassette domain-containing protein [Cyanobacteria bacterium Co-bin8]
MQDTQVISSLSTGPVPDSLVAEARGVALRSVTKKYGPVTAVKELTLDVPAGTYCCLLGPSGCGKTTTMRMIA